MDHMPEASSSTAPPPVVHQATFVFDSGLSRERYIGLIEQNGIVHKIVQRLMQKSGNNEQSLRLGLIITAQEAPYHNPRAMHSVLPPHRQDFRRPSAFLTSLPALVRNFAPHAALAPPKPGSILTNIWDIEDGAGLSISANEPGLSDRFLGGLVGGLELLEHHSLPSSVSPPNALQQMTPESGHHMLSMYYAPQRSQTHEARKQYLVVFTDKASLAAIDADTRGMNQWAREDSSASYDDVDWDNIGDRCRSKDVACSCVILGSPEGGRSTTAPFGRDGSTAEKLRKMCQASSADGPDDVWFTLPPDSDVYLTGMPVKSTASPPPPVPAPPDIKPVLPTGPPSQPAANGPTEAQIQYQQAQKAAMAAKMAQAAHGPQGSPFNALAQLIQSGRLDPAVMTQLAGSIRSTDANVRQKAMQQLSQLMIQAQNKGIGGAGANPNANVNNPNANANVNANGANNNANAGAAVPPNAANPVNAGPSANPAQAATAGPAPNISIPSMNTPAGMTQQQFVAAMQARQRAMQAHTNQQLSQQQQAQLSQLQAQQNNQQSITGQNQAANQNQSNNNTNSQSQNPQATAQTTQQLQSQQQALLLQRQQQLAAQQQQQQAQQAAQQQAQQNQQGQQGQGAQAQSNTPSNNGPQQMRQAAWSGTISWMVKGQERSVIPVQCSVLNHTMNPADLQLQQWPQNLEMSSMTPMNMADLQTYVKTHNAPCVLFSVSPQASPDAKAKMNFLAASLQSKQLAAFIKFGNPGCGILLVSASRGPQTPGNEQGNRLLGVVCLKQPYPTLNPGAAANQNTAPTQAQQPVTINGSVNSGAFQNVPNISPQFLQNAQIQSQLLGNQARPTPTHSRTPSQSQPTAQPQARPSTLQQFANQPNMQTLQQLQMRQLAATTPQPQRPPHMTFTEAQKQGIIKLLREAGINVTENFDPSQIPRETLAQIIGSAKEKSKQNMLKGVATNQAQNAAQAQAQAQNQNANPGLGLGTGLGGQINQGLGGGLGGNLNAGNLAGGAGNMNLPAGYNFMNHMNLQNLQNLGGLGGVGGAGGINMAQLALNQMQQNQNNNNNNNSNQGNNNQGQAQLPQLSAATLASLGQIPGFNLQQFQAAQAAQAAQNAQNNNSGAQSALGLFGQGGLGGLNPAMLNQFQQQQH